MRVSDLIKHDVFTVLERVDLSLVLLPNAVAWCWISYVPVDFKLGSLSHHARGLLHDILRPEMARAIAVEGWPPPYALSQEPSPAVPRQLSRALRQCVPGLLHRVAAARHHSRAYGLEQVARGEVPPSAKHSCVDCGGVFEKLWIRQGLCAVCENGRRRQAEGATRCLFNCKLADQAWCSHTGRCFVCDAPHSYAVVYYHIDRAIAVMLFLCAALS